MVGTGPTCGHYHPDLIHTRRHAQTGRDGGQEHNAVKSLMSTTPHSLTQRSWKVLSPLCSGSVKQSALTQSSAL